MVAAAPPLVHTVIVSATPERAFEAFTGELAAWWDPRLTADAESFRQVELEPAVGADVEFAHEGGLRYRIGTVSAWEPGTRFAMSFCLAMDPDHPSTLAADFEPHGPGTRLTLTHAGWTPENVDERRKFTEWPDLLERYRRHVAG